MPWLAKAGGGLLLLVGLAIGWHFFSTVSAAPSSNIVYSTDGGATWSNSPTAKSGQEVIARLYFNNDGSSNVTDAQMATTLPSGFSRVSGSTKVCLNPGTTNPISPTSEMACNTSAGQGGAINEGAVWSGNALTIAPNAGLYGQATNATTGLMAAGKKKYLNLHQCMRATDPSYDFIPTIVNDPPSAPWDANTNASNTADSAYSCGTVGGWAVYPSISGVQNLDLLGKRYLNLHQCTFYYSDATNGTRYISTAINNTPTAAWNSGTNTANTTGSSASCGSTGWTYYTNYSNTQSLDVLQNRYVNLHQCIFVASAQHSYFTMFIANPPSASWGTGTNASNTPDAALNCPNIGSWPTHSTISDFQAVDLLDTSRGQGFVEYKMVAPAVTEAQAYNQSTTLTGTGTGNPSSNGSLTVEPDLQLTYSTDGGTTWTTSPQVESGANMKVRVFSNNKRLETLANTQFATTLPSGFNRVPGSTKVCLNPGTTDPTNPAAETLCNNSAGQGGAINEGAVWSGSNLTISPTAGLFGQATNATSGFLPAGKRKYINLHQCNRHYDPSYYWITAAVDDPTASTWYASTNVSNTADGAVADCGTVSGWPNYPAISGVQNIDLFGKRYVNLHQCLRYYSDANGTRYMATLIPNPPVATWSAGTNSSNTPSGAVNCGNPGSWTLHTTLSDFQTFDVLQNRYINLHQCILSSSTYLSTFIADPPAAGWGTGTSAANTPDSALECPVISGWPVHGTISDFQVLDLLDMNRGQSFVEFEITAPSPGVQTEYPHTAGLTGTGTGNQAAEDNITVTVDPGVIITETGGSTNVTEGGATDAIQVQLTGPPSQDVTVNFTNDNGQLVAITPITFTPSNWDTPQSVTITANNDPIVEGAHSDFINFSTSSSDTGFNGLSGNNVVSTNITDNDTAGAVITVNNDVVSEDGTTGEFCIALTSRPSADVTIALSSSNTNEATVPASVTILAANWNNSNANCVTVTGVDDGPVGDGLQTVTITTGDVTSADSNYNVLDGTTIDNVTVYNQNNDPPGFAATVTHYYYGVTGGNLTLRKYNPNTHAYSTVSGAAIQQTTIDGQTVTKVVYQITDGGNLDIDGAANGTIVDPVGLAQSVVGAPNTGLGGRR